MLLGTTSFCIGSAVSGRYDADRADMARELGISDAVARIMLLGGGYSVYTTMDIRAQRIIEEFFENIINIPKATSETAKKV